MIRRPTPLSRVLAFLVVALGLGGCAGLLDSNEPPVSEWWLEPVTPARPADRGDQTLVLDLTVGR